MRILHVTPYYTPAYAFGGVTRAVEGMTRALARRGHQVSVLTTDAFDQTRRYDGPPEEELQGVHVVRARNLSPRLRGRLNLSTPLAMRRIARRLLPDVDVVHCHEFRTVENLLATPLAARIDKPLCLSPHGTLATTTGRSYLKRAWDGLLSPALARRFGHVSGLTQHEVDETRALWARFGAEAEFSVIPNGIDPHEYSNLAGGAAFRAQYDLGDGPLCLFVGRLHARKGVDLLAQAFQAAAVPDARLAIVGPDEGMRATLEALRDERIVLTGYLSGAARLAAFAAADVLALPAVGEGLPMVVLEAMAAGLAVIITPGCNLPEVAAAGAGVEVERRTEAIEAALRDLLLDAAKRAAMAANGQQLIGERFTWNSVAQQLEARYEQLYAAGG